MPPPLHIISTGTANTASVLASWERLGIEAILTTSESDVREAPRLVLPGVGSFGAAMRLLKRGLPISTVITDIRMAETTGIELAGEICRMRPETRVIYMTGYAKEFAGSHSQLLTHDVLVKPFTFEQLENVMIQRKRSRH